MTRVLCKRGELPLKGKCIRMRVPDKDGINPRAVSRVGEPSWVKTGDDVWKKEGEFGPEYLSLRKSLPGDRTDVVLKRPDANPKLIESFTDEKPPFRTVEKAREFVEEYDKPKTLFVVDTKGNDGEWRRSALALRSKTRPEAEEEAGKIYRGLEGSYRVSEEEGEIQ